MEIFQHLVFLEIKLSPLVKVEWFVQMMNNLADLSFRIKGQGLAKNQEYFHDIIGYNYRMTNICAAIGCAQLERIEDIIKNKSRVAKNYIENLRDYQSTITKKSENVKHSYWMFTILVCF